MKKKLQVFISSTYIDLIAERQAAVEAILDAGHIPAGMELFQAGSQSQKETIERWIDESDVYLLILGSRYGSIEPDSKMSYTHWEYDYAGKKDKPRFSVVISEKAREEKGKMNSNFIEQEHYQEYKKFKQEVLEQIARMFEDTKDIKLAIHGALNDILERNPNLHGWVSGIEFEKLKQENMKLKNKTVIPQQKVKRTVSSQTQIQTTLFGSEEILNEMSVQGEYLQYLAHLYKMLNGDKYQVASKYDLANLIGLNKKENENISNFLVKESLIRYESSINDLSMTHKGFVLIEEYREIIEDLSDLAKYTLKQLTTSAGRGLKLIDFKGKYPNLKSSSELVTYLWNLERKGLIYISDKAFITGGPNDIEYENNVVSIDFKEIDITDKGSFLLDLLKILS
ncbi:MULTISPECIES: DUF4062 domain-containing protein [Paenibacillus]|uniref:DUF4062 domain-containing protein n=1 Tax=Paenibacillus TaxID=44249 RepID=UPI00096DD2FC|nr:DUF4062 domain-containing protein [Paenibacillus odorifer]OMD18514.1 hypothetical protein BJP50_14390 [Paenibacillus odorifer]